MLIPFIKAHSKGIEQIILLEEAGAVVQHKVTFTANIRDEKKNFVTNPELVNHLLNDYCDSFPIEYKGKLYFVNIGGPDVN